MPAPKGNLNAAKNGNQLKTAIRYGLTIGELPSSMVRIKQRTRQYRQFLENEVDAVHGGVSVTHAHVIDEVAGYEMHALICRWLLRNKPETMSASDIANCSKSIAQAKTARNKALTELKIDKSKVSAWDGILDADSTPTAPQIAPTDSQTTANPGKSRKCSSPAPTPQPVPEASPSIGLAVPNAPESSLASADANPTTDTSRPDCASEATSGATTIDASPEETDRW